MMEKEDIKLKVSNNVMIGRKFEDYDNINKASNSDKYIFFIFNRIPQYEIKIQLTNTRINQYVSFVAYPNELKKSMEIYGIPFIMVRFVELIIYKSDFGRWRVEIVNLKNQDIIETKDLIFINNEIYTRTNEKISIDGSYSGVYIDGLI